MTAKRTPGVRHPGKVDRRWIRFRMQGIRVEWRRRGIPGMRHPGGMATERIPRGRHPDGMTAGRNSGCDTPRWDGGGEDSGGGGGRHPNGMTVERTPGVRHPGKVDCRWIGFRMPCIRMEWRMRGIPGVRHPGGMATERILGGRHPDGMTVGRNSGCDTPGWDGLCHAPQGGPFACPKGLHLRQRG
ncbi:hypothetical protein VitviT2T_007025 [Vitis vinifera]|uniref:Uncharacterized protein n=1 Tax=Vitis vinifera TaxID=29760 RepID=A0ABY9BXJ1_VITVI|nr:hypothetical protein VitviT2T_007025 [Vitis vinifera]